MGDSRGATITRGNTTTPAPRCLPKRHAPYILARLVGDGDELRMIKSSRTSMTTKYAQRHMIAWSSLDLLFGVPDLPAILKGHVKAGRPLTSGVDGTVYTVPT